MNCKTNHTRTLRGALAAGAIALLAGCGTPTAHRATAAPKLASNSAAPTSTTVAPEPPSDAAVLAPIARCKVPTRCRVVDRRDGLVSPAGPATLVAYHYRLQRPFEETGTVFVALVAGGKVLWEPQSTNSFFVDPDDMHRGGIIKSDATGNLFVAGLFGPHGGVMLTLRVEPSGITDFGSGRVDSAFEAGQAAGRLGHSDNPFVANGRVITEDRDGDGRFEIEAEDSDYQPNFAYGTFTRTTLAWDGSGYRVIGCAQVGRDAEFHPIPVPPDQRCW